MLSIACTGSTAIGSTNERIIDITKNQNAQSTTVIKGEGFELRKMARDVFHLKSTKYGQSPTAGILYLANHGSQNAINFPCKILSIGAWQLDGEYVSIISEYTIVVEDDDCIPELQ